MNKPAEGVTSGVCVVHLVWAPLGLAPFEAFLTSYRRHASGSEHRLLVVFNGFAAPPDLAPFLHLLEGLEHATLLLPRPVQDLAAYLEAAHACTERSMCFLNSYSVILTNGWLAKLRAALGEPGVGVVGATGSYESPATSLWAVPLPPDHGRRLQRFAHRLRRHGRVLLTGLTHPLFPNPHLRTNTFMIERQRLLALRAGPFRSKADCYRFESGRRSLTRQILARGLAVRVVGANGVAYPPERWRESKTFRVGEQPNLLVADNRTREYGEADPDKQRWLAGLAWEKQHG